ncbi:MAG: 7-cyano-7-deazaguanine synthase QueC [Phycisphaerales bacterium]|nr:7-cyano-7-deazaguanine synthase QueC [Phycisphaerales bacterium]
MSAAPRAVVLLSGGMDSAVVLAEMRHAGFECHALSFDYGQRHRVELERAAEVAGMLGAASHRTVRIDLRAFGASALTADIAVPKDRDVAAAHDIPVTYVPARNTIFLAHALAMAESTGARDIAIGVNAIDYSGYPDCRPEFVEAFERLANLATRAGVEAAARGERWMRVHVPLLRMGKADIVRRGRALGVDLSRTISCYDPTPAGLPCGRCDACQLRERGFREAG